MFADKFPMDTLREMIEKSAAEAALKYSFALQAAGKEPSPDDLKQFDEITGIMELFTISFMRHLDEYDLQSKE